MLHAQIRSLHAPGTINDASRHSLSLDQRLVRTPPFCPRRLRTNQDTHRAPHVIGGASRTVATTDDHSQAAGSVNWNLDGPEADIEVTPKAKLVVVVPSEGNSPLGVPWQVVMLQMARKLVWVDPGFQLKVFKDTELLNVDTFQAAAQGADILLAIGVTSATASETLAQYAAAVPVFVAFDSAQQLNSLVKLKGFRPEDSGLVQSVSESLPWKTQSKDDRVLLASVNDLYKRGNPDDILLLCLKLINGYFASVALLQNLRASGVGTIVNMMTKCGSQVVACVSDDKCKAALDCLQECDPLDQVCNYQCIVSHETPKLEDFTLCILQKHNCMGLSAEIPALPDVRPSVSWRGEPMTWAGAEDIFIGHLDGGARPWSWRVAAGQNSAYDKFPCQNQLFYRGRGTTMWYDPVFRVKTFDGEWVWRRRHYRVRRAAEPGAFYFSVLDNGVTSNEYWRIVHCEDDLSWALFYYAGAASAAGQVYTGAILATPDGAWPAEEHDEKLRLVLEAAGIQRWELFSVDNSCCEGAPLDLPPAVVAQLSAAK